MRNVLNKISDIANKMAIIIGCTAIIITAGSCFTQVFSRYVLNNSFSWTEELCRYAAVVVYMFGFSIATKAGSNPSIDFLTSKLKGKTKIWHSIYCGAAMLICGAIIVWFGIVAYPTGAKSHSAVLHIPANYMYMVIVVAMAFCMIHAAAGIANDIHKLRTGEEG